MHFACSIGQDIENAILSINTVILYVIIFALLGLLIFLFIRNAFKRHKFAVTSDSDVFEEMDRRSRQSNLQALLARFPNLEQSFAWIDEQLTLQRTVIWISISCSVPILTLAQPLTAKLLILGFPLPQRM